MSQGVMSLFQHFMKSVNWQSLRSLNLDPEKKSSVTILDSSESHGDKTRLFRVSLEKKS